MLKPHHKPNDTEIARAIEVAKSILDAHVAGKPIPSLAGIDAVNVANVLAEFFRLAFRPTASGPAQPLPVNRRAPAANEVLPPEQRASWCREKTEHDR